MDEKELANRIVESLRQTTAGWVSTMSLGEQVAQMKILAGLIYDLKDIGLHRQAEALEEKLEALTAAMPQAPPLVIPHLADESGQAANGQVQNPTLAAPRRRGRPPRTAPQGMLPTDSTVSDGGSDGSSSPSATS